MPGKPSHHVCTKPKAELTVGDHGHGREGVGWLLRPWGLLLWLPAPTCITGTTLTSSLHPPFVKTYSSPPSQALLTLAHGYSFTSDGRHP